jgi:hypothetical protein
VIFRFINWVLATLAILAAVSAAVVVSLAARFESAIQLVVMWALIATGVLWALGLSNRIRFWWALRGVAVAVLIAAVGYFVSELRQEEGSLWEGALVMLLLGVPALRYLLTGRADYFDSAPTPKRREAVAEEPAAVTTDSPWDAVVRPGVRYRVMKAFTDFDGELHPEGEEWTFLRNAFLPYESGMTFFVSFDGREESQIRLQWRPEAQSHVLDHLAEYVGAVSGVRS